MSCQARRGPGDVREGEGAYRSYCAVLMAQVDRWLLLSPCAAGMVVMLVMMAGPGRHWACVHVHVEALLFFLTTAVSTSSQHEDTHAAPKGRVHVETEAFLAFLCVAAAWDLDVCLQQPWRAKGGGRSRLQHCGRLLHCVLLLVRLFYCN